MKVYTFDEQQLTDFANQVKDALLPEDEAARCAVVVHQPGVLGKFWDKLRGVKPDGGLCISVVSGIKPEKKQA